jgi:hypothetical protein
MCILSATVCYQKQLRNTSVVSGYEVYVALG